MAAATAIGARFHHVDVTDEGSAFDRPKRLAAYAASKAGIEGMSLPVARDLEISS